MQSLSGSFGVRNGIWNFGYIQRSCEKQQYIPWKRYKVVEKWQTKVQSYMQGWRMQINDAKVT